MFYDNRVNQIRERRRVLNSIRSQIEAYENGEPTDFDPDADVPSPYLNLKVSCLKVRYSFISARSGSPRIHCRRFALQIGNYRRSTLAWSSKAARDRVRRRRGGRRGWPQQRYCQSTLSRIWNHCCILEFFRLIIEKVFSPDYGLFIFDDETDFYWFNPYPPIFGAEEEKVNLNVVIISIEEQIQAEKLYLWSISNK